MIIFFLVFILLQSIYVCNGQPDQYSRLESESCGRLTRTNEEIVGDEPLFPPTNNERIAGGVESTYVTEWYPWTVEIRINFTTYENGIRKRQRKTCSGSIINRWWIISAAHCFVIVRRNEEGVEENAEVNFKLVEINVGMFGRRRLAKNDPMIQAAPARVVRHEQFLTEGVGTRNNEHFDISLVKLNQRLEYIVVTSRGTRGNRYQINSICLPRREPDVTLRRVHAAAGFGQLGKRRNQNRTLMVMSVYPVHYQRCWLNKNRFKAAFIYNRTREESWRTFQQPNSFYDVEMVNRSLCSSTLLDNQSSCHGDSGGPLFVRRPDGDQRFELTGVIRGHSNESNRTFQQIVVDKIGEPNVEFAEEMFQAYSQAYPCGYQTQFMNVHHFLDWIERTINNDELTRAGEDYTKYFVYTLGLTAFAGTGFAQIQNQIKKRQAEQLAKEAEEESQRKDQPPLTPRVWSPGVMRTFHMW